MVEAGKGTYETPDVWLYVSEISHRTLNDYMALLGMLRRAASLVDDLAVNSLLGDMADRLCASAHAHQALRRPRENGPRDLHDELLTLCGALSRSALADRGVRLTLVSEPLTLDARQCWQICLIISELVMNAARHAFDEGPGVIAIDARVVGDDVCCAVADDGSANRSPLPGSGTAIVDGLAFELGGRIARCYGPKGSTVVLSIPYVPRRPA